MTKPFTLKNGSLFITTEAPGGLYNSTQLKKIAELCGRDGLMLKATEDQRLAMIVGEKNVAKVTAELKTFGVGVRHYQSGLHQPVSCIGAMCADHQQDALDSAIKSTAELQNIQLDGSLKIGINGCAQCCVPCHTLDVSVVGSESGYSISIGGKNSQIPELASFVAEGVPAKELPGLLKKIVETFNSEREAGESLNELIERKGPNAFISVLAPYSQDAASNQDPFAEAAPEMPPPEIDTAEAATPAFSVDINPSELSDLDAGEQEIPIETTPTDSSVDIDLKGDDLGALELETPEPELILEEPGDEKKSGAGHEIADLIPEDDIEDLPADLTLATPVADTSSELSVTSEDDEGALEDKLDLSIEEQKVLGSVSKDENLEERDEALGLVEGSAELTLEEEAPLTPEDDFSMEEETVLEAPLEELPMAQEQPLEEEETMDEAPSFDIAETPAILVAADAGEGCKAIQFDNGKMVVEFASGARVSLNLSVNEQEKRLQIAGKTIMVKRVAGGIQAEVDGLEVFFPNKKAA